MVSDVPLMYGVVAVVVGVELALITGMQVVSFAAVFLACVAGVQRGGRGEVECEREARYEIPRGG